MDWVWTWGGVSFGYRVDDSLYTHDGFEAGRFHGDEVYGKDGHYIGEVVNDRLITNRSKKAWRKSSFFPRRSTSYVKYCNYVGYVMYAGCEDFPPPEEFTR